MMKCFSHEHSRMDMDITFYIQGQILTSLTLIITDATNEQYNTIKKYKLYRIQKI
jgi:hypothetical protein